MVDYEAPNFLLFVSVCGPKLRAQENRALLDYKVFTKMNS